MDLNAPTLWLIAAGVLVAAELASGTFYLLMVALGCLAGAAAAYFGLASAAQISTAALVGMAATSAWHFKRAKQARSAPAESNRDVNLDIGETVQVVAWDAHGQARISYRGSMWNAAFQGVGSALPGEHTIVALHANKLVLARKA